MCVTTTRQSSGDRVSDCESGELFALAGFTWDGGFHNYEPLAADQRSIMAKQALLPGNLVLVGGWLSELRDRGKAR